MPSNAITGSCYGVIVPIGALPILFELTLEKTTARRSKGTSDWVTFRTIQVMYRE